jgi:hypothetical protein
VREPFEVADVATRSLFGACAVPGACLAGVVTLLLGGVCLAGAFVVPCLFGPVAAAVIAAERLLCAARSYSTRLAAVWTVVAGGWIALASWMLHTPSVSAPSLQWLILLLIGSSTVCRLWARWGASPSESPPVAIWVVAAAVVAQLATVFGVTMAPLSRVAAAVAIELVLIGILRLLQADRSRRDAHSMERAAAQENAVASLAKGMLKLAPGLA